MMHVIFLTKSIQKTRREIFIFYQSHSVFFPNDQRSYSFNFSNNIYHFIYALKNTFALHFFSIKINLRMQEEFKKIK